MKKIVKLLSLLLALLMLVSVFASCNKTENDDNEKETGAGSDAAASTTGVQGDVNGSEAETKVPDIEVKNWGGKDYRILGRQDPGSDWAWNFEVFREEVPEDVVGTAVWKRNQTLEETYGIKVKGTLNQDFNSIAATTLASGEDLYDLMLLHPNKFNGLTMQGYFLNLKSLEHINLEHDAWFPATNEELSFGGKLYYTTNKFLIQDKNRIFIMFYNRDMAKELKLGHFEDFVFDGTWTLEKALELAKVATADSDGQAGMTKYDTWGIACSDANTVFQMVVGSGFRYTEPGSDGYPTLVGPTDLMIQRLDEVIAITSSDSFYCDTIRDGTVDYSDCAHQMFYRGQVLLFGEAVSQLVRMAKYCNFVYAPLPNPKSDEAQEKYYAPPNLNNGCLFGVPSMVVDTGFAGYGLEVISELSVDTSYNAFIEVKSLLQNVPDDDAAKCLRTAFENVVYDAGYMCDLGLSYGSSPYTANLYARLYGRIEKGASNNLEKLKKKYAELST